MTNNIRDIINLGKQKDKGLQKRISVIRCQTVGVDYSNDCSVMSRPGYIWVREHSQDGSIFQVFNDSVKRLVGLNVLVSNEYGQPYRYRVVGIDWDVTPSTNDYPQMHAPSVINHASSHEWQDTYPGADAISVYPRALIPLRINPSVDGAVKIDITRGVYAIYDKIIQYPGEVGYDLGADIPAADYMVGVLVYLDANAQTVSHLLGETVADTGVIAYPDVPNDVLPLAYVKLYGGMTELLESDIILDLRPVYSITGGLVRKEIAILAAEIDMQLSRHIVEGG